VFYKQKNIIRIVAGCEGRVFSDMSCSSTYQQILSVFIHSCIYFHIYPFTGTTQGCGDSHNIIYNISVELQMS